MKLLLVATVADTLETYLTAYARHFRTLGWQVDGMANGATASAACTSAFDRCWEAHWSRNPRNLRGLARAWWDVRQVARRGEYDLVHVHTPIAAFVTRSALRFLPAPRPPVVYTVHGFHFHPKGSVLGNAAFLVLEKLVAGWTDRLVVINAWDEAAVRRWRLIETSRLRHFPGAGFDHGCFDRERVGSADVAGVRKELGLGRNDPLFLMVARCDRPKRPEDVVVALARCRRRECHLAIAGAGPLLTRLRVVAKTYGVADRVHLLGHRQDVPELMKTSVATLLVSDREGLPLTVMESLSMGVPVIGSDVRGIRDLLSGGRGILVSPGDVTGIAEALAWVLENPSAVRAMGRRGARSVSPFRLDNVLRLYRELYAEVLNVPITEVRPRAASVSTEQVSVAG